MRSTTQAASPVRMLAAIASLVLTTLFISVPSASAAVDVRNPGEGDLRAYCISLYGSGANVKLIEPTAYGWRCEKKNGALLHINMHTVCVRINKPTPNVIDYFYEWTYYKPDIAWGCVQLQHGYQGRLSVDKVCKSGGNPHAYAYLAGTGRHSVADWMCKDGNLDIKPYLAVGCGIIYGGSWEDRQIPRFNYWDPWSTTCWR